MKKYVGCSLILLGLLVARGLILGSTEKVTIGEKGRIASEVLKEESEIWVSLPPGYDVSTDRYPVLYLLDGRYHFFHASGLVDFLIKARRIPPIIVVAIASSDRNRDFLPTRMGHIPTSGKAERFLRFIRTELIPQVEKKYRTIPFRLIMGHSFGGTFLLYALQQKPDLFQAFIIASGALWWDDKLLIKNAIPFFEKMGSFDRFLYLTVGNESIPLVYSFREFSNVLKFKAPRGLKWKSEYMKSENHASTPHRSLYRGLEFVFEQWLDVMNVAEKGVEKFQAKFEKLSEFYGYPIELSESLTNTLGYELLKQKKIDPAVGFFLLNIRNHPRSPNVYDSLGEAYELAGEVEKAEKNYLMAIKIAKETKNININVYKMHLYRLKKQKFSEK